MIVASPNGSFEITTVPVLLTWAELRGIAEIGSEQPRLIVAEPRDCALDHRPICDVLGPKPGDQKKRNAKDRLHARNHIISAQHVTCSHGSVTELTSRALCAGYWRERYPLM